MFFMGADDPLFREHIDQPVFDASEDISRDCNYTKRLTCQYLEALIENEGRIKNLKHTFLGAMGKAGTSFEQLF